MRIWCDKLSVGATRADHIGIVEMQPFIRKKEKLAEVVSAIGIFSLSGICAGAKGYYTAMLVETGSPTHRMQPRIHIIADEYRLHSSSTQQA